MEVLSINPLSYIIGPSSSRQNPQIFLSEISENLKNFPVKSYELMDIPNQTGYKVFLLTFKEEKHSALFKLKYL